MALPILDGVMEYSKLTEHPITSILFGNPGNKRTLGWQQALHYHRQQPALEVSYARLLHAIRAGETLPEVLDSMSKRQQIGLNLATTLRQSERSPSAMSLPASQDRFYSVRDCLHHVSEPTSGRSLRLRLDAPGENAAVERGLIALGAADAGDKLDDSLLPTAASHTPMSIAYSAARRLEGQYGRILYPAQWFRGYCRLLAWLHNQVKQYIPAAQWMNDPADIALMFDKRACSLHLHAAGIAVPPPLLKPTSNGLSSSIQSYDELRQTMEEGRIHRVFIKLFCGSAASGVIAYQYQPRTGAEIATTTIGMEQVGGETIFYNSGRLIRYTNSRDIRQIVDWIAGEGIHVERWISKAMLNGYAYDARQLVCQAEAGHAVLRLSRTPITNLHLRNERLLLDDAELDEAVRMSIRHTAEQALATFPRSFCAGMDVLVPADGSRPLIMDVNPFGDLLYHVRHQGMGTYEWELSHWLKQ